MNRSRFDGMLSPRNPVARHEKENPRSGSGQHRKVKHSYQEQLAKRELKEYLRGLR